MNRNLHNRRLCFLVGDDNRVKIILIPYCRSERNGKGVIAEIIAAFSQSRDIDIQQSLFGCHGHEVYIGVADGEGLLPCSVCFYNFINSHYVRTHEFLARYADIRDGMLHGGLTSLKADFGCTLVQRDISGSRFRSTNNRVVHFVPIP